MKIKKTLVPLCLSVLFVVASCSQNSGTSSMDAVKSAQDTVGGESSQNEKPYAGIVYVNSDSVVSKYKMSEELMTAFTIKAEKAEKKFKTKTRAFETKFRQYQTKIDKGLVTRTEILTYQEKLKKEEQVLMNYGRQMEIDLKEEQMVIMNKISHEIREFLYRYNEEKRYSLILNDNSVTTSVLVSDPALNITNDVVEGLNKEYLKKVKE